jgi:hypothetical protein
VKGRKAEETLFGLLEQPGEKREHSSMKSRDKDRKDYKDFAGPE